MRLAVAGGHGQIAPTLTGRLTAGGEEVVSLVRNPDHADDVRARGGQPDALVREPQAIVGGKRVKQVMRSA
jgi:uncharacterized protein YbjT (DUF2867 family)